MTIDGFFGNATISAVIGALAAVLVSHLMQKSYLSGSSIDSLSDLLIDLKAEARSYWRKSGQDANREEQLERLVVRCREKFLHHDRRFNGTKDASKIKDICVQLHTLLTGGMFASKDRRPDPGRLLQGEKLIEQLRGLL